MDKLITVNHAINIIENITCLETVCKRQVLHVAPGDLRYHKCSEDCEILKIKEALFNATADAVLTAVAVDARFV